MKYLLLFLLCFNLQAKSLEAIDLMTLDTYLGAISRNVLPECEIVYERDVSLAYDNLTYKDCEKPTLEFFEEKLEVYKQKLRDRENARLAEVARVQALESRFAALKNTRSSMDKCGYNIIPNAKLFKQNIIKDNDLAKLECLESKNDEVKAAAQARLAKPIQLRKDFKTIKNDATIKPALKRVLLHLMQQYKEEL